MPMARMRSNKALPPCCFPRTRGAPSAEPTDIGVGSRYVATQVTLLAGVAQVQVPQMGTGGRALCLLDEVSKASGYPA